MTYQSRYITCVRDYNYYRLFIIYVCVILYLVRDDDTQIKVGEGGVRDRTPPSTFSKLQLVLLHILFPANFTKIIQIQAPSISAFLNLFALCLHLGGFCKLYSLSVATNVGKRKQRRNKNKSVFCDSSYSYLFQFCHNL